MHTRLTKMQILSLSSTKIQYHKMHSGARGKPHTETYSLLTGCKIQLFLLSCCWDTTTGSRLCTLQKAKSKTATSKQQRKNQVLHSTVQGNVVGKNRKKMTTTLTAATTCCALTPTEQEPTFQPTIEMPNRTYNHHSSKLGLAATRAYSSINP